ncbi:Serine/threonine-protein phosphatase PP1 [Dirofilaria immitis]
MLLFHNLINSKRETKSDSEIDYLKCVINARPLLFEKCIGGMDSMSMCYTVEFDDTDTILYGCTVISQHRIPMDNINCQNNVFKKCPTTLSKSRFPRRRLQYCCCNTTKCNGNYLHRRETKVIPKGIDKNKSDIAVPELKRAAQDINMPESVMGNLLEANKVSRISWGLISGIACAVVVMVCIVAIAVVFINRRRQKRQTVLNASVGEMVSLRTDADDADNNDDVPGMICTPGGKSSTNVVHSDRTDTIVPAQLTLMEQNALIRTMKQNGQLKTVMKGKNLPKITRVITYAASDDITNVDFSSRDDNAFSEDLSGDLLLKMIRNGPKQFSFKFEEIREILLQGAKVFLEEPTLLEVPLPCIVYGDIHGQYSDLHRWFNLNGWPSQVRSVFLGDFVDRGSHGIEVVALLTALKIRFPKNIFLCRGNHEEESLNRAYSFYEEVCIRFSENLEGKDGRALYPYFRILFNNLPLAVLIGGRILGMHGGIGPRLTSLQAIREIRRPLEEFEVGSLECDLVWSDPDTSPDRTGFRSNLEREPLYGIGQLFASDTVQNLCKKLDIDMLIRGHQAPLHGYALFSGGCMLTLFSAPGYRGSSNSDINMGASLEISTSMNITIKQIQVTEKFRQKRIADVEQRKANVNKKLLQSSVKNNELMSQSTSSLFR